MSAVAFPMAVETISWSWQKQWQRPASSRGLVSVAAQECQEEIKGYCWGLDVCQ
jgi:hypothetical protein